jgi:hypothetical protein
MIVVDDWPYCNKPNGTIVISYWWNAYVTYVVKNLMYIV